MSKTNTEQLIKESLEKHEDDLMACSTKPHLIQKNLSDTFLSSIELSDHIRAARALTVVASDCDFESYHEEIISDYMLALQLLLNRAEELCAEILKA